MNNIPYSMYVNPDFIPVTYSNWYPPVTVTEKNLSYAQILMPDLAATVSEMTTVHQYLYQSWTVGNDRTAHYPSWRQAGMPFFRAVFILEGKYGRLQLRYQYCIV